MDVIDSGDADDNYSINHDGSALDEDYGSGLVGSAVIERWKICRRI